MILDWASAGLGLLEHDPQSNVLGRFPLPLRRALIDSVATSLLNFPGTPGGPGVPAPPSSGGQLGPAYISNQQWLGLQQSCTWLTAPAHVWWAMEVIGQGFALPLDDYNKDVVEKCLAVYSGWILGSLALGDEAANFRDTASEGERATRPGLHRLQRALTSCRPLGIRVGNPLANLQIPGSKKLEGADVLQWFYESCFKHMSQLFQPRTPAFGYNQPPLPPELLSIMDPTLLSPASPDTTPILGSGLETPTLLGTSGLVPLVAATEDAAIEQLRTAPEPGRSRGGPASSPALGSSPLQSGPGSDLLKHVDLCKTALGIFTRCARAFADLQGTTSGLTNQTWSTLLKCMFSASDVLLSTSSPARGAPRHENLEGEMGDLLAQELVRSLMEIWLRAGGQVGIDLWGEIKERYPAWCLNRSEPIQQWASTSLALTTRVVAGLLSKDGGFRIIIKYADGASCNVDRWLDGPSAPGTSPREAWWRILNLPGDPATLPAEQFTLHCLGISKLTDILLGVQTSRDLASISQEERQNSPPPDSNTILAMFGTWMWCSISRSGGWEFEEGRALSHASLIRVIAAPQRREPIMRTYLERFYVSFVEGLTKGDIGVVTSIMVNTASRGLWDVLKGEDGARFVLPDLIVGLSRVIPELHASFSKPPPIPIDELRRACIQLVGDVYAMVNEFSPVSLDLAPEDDGQSPPPLPPRQWEKVAAMGGIRPRLLPSQASMEFGPKVRDATAFLRQWYEVQQRGLTGVVKGVYARARMAKLNLDSSKGFHDLPATFGLLKPLIASVALASLANETNPVNARYLLNVVACVVFEEHRHTPEILVVVARAIVEKIGQLAWPEDVTCAGLDVLSKLILLIKAVSEVHATIGREIVSALSHFVDRLLENENLVPHRKVIIKAIDCMTRWCMLGKWILEDKEATAAFVATLCRAIGVLNPEDEFAAIEVAAEGLTPNPLGSLPALAMNAPPVPPTRPIGLPATDVREYSQNLLMSAAQQAGFSERFVNVTGGLVQSVVDLGAGRRHAKPRPEAITAGPRPRVPSGLVALPAPPVSTNAVPGVSSSTLDGGVGMPSFAIQQALVMIKISAEIALQHFLNLSTSIPPYGEITGTTCLGTLWDEHSAAVALCAAPGAQHTNDISVVLQRYAKIYALDNRVLISVVDEPPLEDGSRNAPSATVILRDATSRNSWSMSLNYGPSGERLANVEDNDLGEETSEPDDPHLSAESLYRNVQPRGGVISGVAGDQAIFTRANVEPVNALAIPALNDLVRLGTAEAGQIDMTRKMVVGSELPTDSTELALSSEAQSESQNSITAVGPGRATRTPDNDDLPHAARLVLTQLGLLGLQNQRRHRVVPLAVSDSLWRDLEKLDAMPERESVKVAVLFANSGQDTVDEMLNAKEITQEFTDFLHGLGWPVDVSTHPGQRAGLDASICTTALYFATRSVETVFHVPYVLAVQGGGGSTAPAGALGQDALSKPTSRRSQMRSLFHQLAQDDLVYVVWVEDLTSYLTLPKKIGRGQFFIFVHPIPNSWGLYLIRLHISGVGSSNTSSHRTQYSEDTHLIGPLTDGAIVSREALSLLVRSTAIAAHNQLAAKKPGSSATGARRSHLQRGHEIESIISRHRMPSRFFTGVF